MFVNCELRAAPNEWAGPPRERKSQSLTIDIHNHFEVDEAIELMADATAERAKSQPGFPYFRNDLTREVTRRQRQENKHRLSDPAVRIKDMDAMGIDIQALTVTPAQTYYWADAALGRDAARLINDKLAGIAAAHPERFVAMGTVPLQNTELAIAEMGRCTDELGMRGLQLATNVDGEELSHDRLAPFFARAEELGLFLFLHPVGFSDGGRLSNHHFGNLIGNPLDTTVCIMHLIFDGTLARHPGLTICVAHGGGFAGAYPARMDHGYFAREDCRQHITEPPTTYLKRLYFDTMVFGDDQLKYLIGKYGSDRILLGTDYCADMGETDPVGLVEAIEGLTPAERDDICGLNAAELLGIDPG